MTDTDLHQPGLGPLRAAAEAAELAQAVTGLVSIDGCRLTDSDPLAPLARDIARSLTEAGLTVHFCAQQPPYEPELEAASPLSATSIRRRSPPT